MKKINLVLQDGSLYEGFSFGHHGDVTGEVVFNTSMTGYQEMLTDPSYRGQILIPTYPMIGNYGVSYSDVESNEIQVSGFAVRQFCETPSHNNSIMNIDEYLKKNKIPGIYGLDTRSIVKKIRNYGVMMGSITLDENVDSVLKKLNSIGSYDEYNFVSEVSSIKKTIRKSDDKKFNIAVLDLGVKNNIIRLLESRSCKVTVYPFNTEPTEIISSKPDGIVLSPGPGDPNNLVDILENVKNLISSKIPILGICLGHQLIAKSLGASTYKLPYGHRGGNQPVKDLKSNKVYVTAQNHGYAVSNENMPSELEVTHLNLNDNTISGLCHKNLPVFSIQYHSEASPGPKDSEYIFDEFIQKIISMKESL
ncbi:MAG: carbamoyl phosphate synthase small subunit [Chloroflexi bacterium]|nr:carbamoyl phosphate synthase small subunit [Chloroflexota bacterium]|tara:strand:- start:9355 stop:10446 length:1092 start_codon:yes stop_codon:yes gene_type:complete